MDFFHTLLAAIFPETGDARLVRALTPEIMRAKVSVQEIPHGARLLSYRDPAVRALVWQIKYRNDARAYTLLAGVLRDYLLTVREPHLLVPIPLSLARERERGYNQVEEVAKRAVQTPHTLVPALVRTRHTIPQTQLSRKARLTNLVGAFAVDAAYRAQVDGADCILIDDVSTTGATLAEARRALMSAGAHSVTTLALAH